MALSFVKRNFKTVCLFVLFLIVVFGTYAINPMFLSPGVMRNILLLMSASGTMMVGISCLLMSGSIDLSSDAIALLGIVTFAYLCQGFPNIPWPVLLIGPIILVVVIGLCHSFLTNVLGFMPFIATIGMSSVYSGLASVWTKSAQVMIARPSFTKLATIAYFGRIPLFIVVMAVIILAYGIMLSSTRFGRSIYMCGGNRYAARLCGLKPARVSTILFINNAVIALIGGLMWASQKKMASLTFTSSAPTMSGMTAAILGGVSFMGGGNTGLGGAFVGLLLLNTFTQSINYIPAFAGQTWWNVILQGFILIIALIIDNYSARRQAKRLLLARQEKVAA